MGMQALSASAEVCGCARAGALVREERCLGVGHCRKWLQDSVGNTDLWCRTGAATEAWRTEGRKNQNIQDRFSETIYNGHLYGTLNNVSPCSLCEMCHEDCPM